MVALPPLHHEVRVDLEPKQAFELFTKGIGDWWPVARLGVFGAGSTVAFTDDGRLLERNGGRASSWGEVLEWEPGDRLAMTWHPGRPDTESSKVTVTFTPYGEQTLVTLVHSGWEAYADAVAARTEYSGGWPSVMALFAAAGCQNEEQAPEPATWTALLFTPAEGQGSEVFEDERFPGHIAFLEMLDDSGYLVAAGPMLDEPGAGMTIVRLPGDGRLDEIERLAEVDTSVSSGLFHVQVRPWQVFFAPGVV